MEDGVIIGEDNRYRKRYDVISGVTLGGTGKEKGKRHPTLEDNVIVSAGAKILGSFTIGENAKIGAGSVVLEEVTAKLYCCGCSGTNCPHGKSKNATHGFRPNSFT